MAFIPQISLNFINRESSLVNIKDITANYPTYRYGYGVPGAFTSNAQVSTANIILQHRWYPNDVAINGDTYSGNIFNPNYLNVGVSKILDGVTELLIYYPMAISIQGYTATLGTDKTTFTLSKTGINTTEFTTDFDGVSYLTNINNIGSLFEIESIDATLFTITLKAPLTETIDTTNFLMAKMYRGYLYILVLNEGQRKLCFDIANMATSTQLCSPEIVDNLLSAKLLLDASGIFFSYKDYAKAHNSAVLLCKRISLFENYNDYGIGDTAKKSILNPIN